MVTNEKSQLVDAIHYFPFGEVWLEERPSSLPEEFFFTAKEFDPETGFYNFGARYLDPRFSKWMTADPALGSYLPGVGAAVGYRSPGLANAWRGHPDLPGLGGAFTPSNLALYGYGHQNPETLWDPDGSEALVCTPDNIRGDRPTSYFSNLSQGQADLQNLQAANQIATSWAGPIFGVLPALGHLFGTSEQNVQVLAEVNFNIASAATAVIPRGGASSVTAAMRRPAPAGQSAAGTKIPVPTLKSSPFGAKIENEVPTIGVPRNWSPEQIADSVVDYQTSIASRKAELAAFDASGRGSATQRLAHARRITEEESFLRSLEKALSSRER